MTMAEKNVNEQQQGNGASPEFIQTFIMRLRARVSTDAERIAILETQLELANKRINELSEENKLLQSVDEATNQSI